jgi:chromosomal replication initiator protein
MQKRAPWIVLPENRAARQAVERVRDCVCGQGLRRAINPLLLHGPPGTGKTHLLDDLVEDVTRRQPGLLVARLPAAELAPAEAGDLEQQQALRQADLVVVEDLQHLGRRATGVLAALIDRCLGRQRQLVFTGGAGPAHLEHLPVRLTSRLAQGLVVALEPLGPDSRRDYLRQRLPFDLPDEAVTELACGTSGSARQLEGLVTQLEQLAASLGRPLDSADLAGLLDDDTVRRPTLERIVQQVGSYFRVEPRRLCSAGRSREVLLPRQVSMYLARRLTGLSLEQIGAYFGGRDHSTVLHACRKVERALGANAGLGGAVRRLHADLA